MDFEMNLDTARSILEALNASIQNHLADKDIMLKTTSENLGIVWQSPSADEFQALMQAQVAKLTPLLAEINNLRDQLATAIREAEDRDRQFG